MIPETIYEESQEAAGIEESQEKVFNDSDASDVIPETIHEESQDQAAEIEESQERIFNDSEASDVET